MPRMDGFSMVRALKAIPHEIEIIVASRRVEPELENDFLDMGVREIFHKPYNQESLITAIAKFFSTEG